jgi:hypothetical protein
VILDDFSFLSKCPSIEMLDLFPSFQAPNHISYEPVYSMPHLRLIQPHTVYGRDDKFRTEFDCSKLLSAPMVESFGADCRKDSVKNLTSLTGLKSLLISSYKRENLKEAIGSPSLDTLRLLLCPVTSLDGSEISKSLKAVSIERCYKLENIDALYDNRATLTGLIIRNCKNIKDYSVLGELKQLTRLTLGGSGSIPSLSFIKQLPNLKTLTLGINVEDGDLSYCDRLDHVSFYPNRRHYNRKDEDFPHKKRDEGLVLGDEGIEAWRQHVLR